MSKSLNQKYAILLLFVSPVLAVYYSIKDLGWEQRKWVLILFVTIFGSLMQNPISGDIIKYINHIEAHYMGLPFEQFSRELWHIIIFNPLPTTNDDVYFHLIGYLAGGVLQWPRFFITITSFIFGYFYISALSKILIWEKGTPKPLIFIALVIVMIIYRGIDTMQTIRNATAIWILFDGVLGYFQTGKKKYLVQILITPLVHFSYFILSIPALIVVVLKKIPSKVIIAAYIASFFLSIATGGIVSQIERTELGRTKLKSYYRHGEIQKRVEDPREGRWYAKHGKGRTFYMGSHALAFSIIMGGFFRKRMNSVESAMFSTGLLMATMANLGDFIPAFASRAMFLAGLFVVATATMLVIRGELSREEGFNMRIGKIMLYISIILFVPKMVYTLSNTLVYSSIFVTVMPFVGWFMGENNIVIREFIGYFL